MPIFDNGGGSPFPRNAGLDALTQTNQGMQNLLPMILEYKKMQADKMPLGQMLGVSQDQMPGGLKSFYNTPVGKMKQFAGMLGPSGLHALMMGNTNFVFDNKTGSFQVLPEGQAPTEDQSPVQGAKAGDVVKAMAKPKPPAGPTPEQVAQVADAVMNKKQAFSKLPGFGANSLKSAVAIELAHRGADVTGLDLDYQAKQDYLKTVNSSGFQQTYKLLAAVGPNLDNLVKMSGKLDRTQFKQINRAQLEIMKQSGSKEAAAFGVGAIEVGDQIAKILQGGGTGSATSDKKLQQANDILSGNYSIDQFQAIAKTMKDLLGEREKAMKTMNVQTLGNQTAPKIKVDPAKRFQQLIKAGKTKAQAYAILAEEGH